jgi:hypothetical protein
MTAKSSRRRRMGPARVLLRTRRARWNHDPGAALRAVAHAAHAAPAAA